VEPCQKSFIIIIMAFRSLADLKEYEAYISLNNIGVSFLERGCYEDALETFKDALDLIQAIFSSVQFVEESLLRKCNVEGTLQKASQRLARMASVTVGPRIWKHFNLAVLSDVYDTTPDTVDLAIRRAPSRDFGFAVRIDTSDGNDSNLHLDSAIIFHNFGIAYRCHSHTSARTYDALVKLLEVAFGYSHYAYRMVSDQSCVSQVDRAFLIQAVILQNLVQLCFQLSIPLEGVHYYSQLNGLQALLSRVGPFKGQANTIAAAA
jgi:tetratricopeptide (TPR) repeat protein